VTRERSAGSLRRQLVLLTSAVTALGVVVLALLVQLILARTADNSLDNVLDDRADVVVGAVRGASSGTSLVVPTDRIEAGVAVYDASGRLVGGNAPADLRSEYDDLATSDGRRTVDVAETTRIHAQPFRTPGGAAGVVVVSERTRPYEQAEHYAFAVSLGAGLLLVGMAAALTAWVSRRSLAPVAAMAHTAHDWSEHDLGRRFDLGPATNELTALGDTLDTLLDKVAAAIRSEQRLTSELAHELRTPLTTIRGAADLALLRPGLSAEHREDLEEIRVAAHRMADTIAGLLDLARTGATPEAATTRLRPVVAEAVETAGGERPGLTLDLPRDQVIALPHALAVRALVPVLDNALRLAEHVRVSAAPDGRGFVAVRVADDGPGVPADQRESVFEPGRTDGSGSGAGLGLALARRIARSAGGDVLLDDDVAQTIFVIRYPLA
jgi:signal transduction histidine kinase